MLLFAHDLAQATTHPVAHDRAAEPASSNEPGAEVLNFIGSEYAQDQQLAAVGAALLLDALKFRCPNQAPAFRKRKRMTRWHFKFVDLAMMPQLRECAKIAVQQKSFLEHIRGKTLLELGRSGKNYGAGVEVVVLDSVLVSVPGEDVVLIVVFDSVLLEVAGEGLTMVVLLSFFSAGGVTVVSFCSQATSKAVPARTQIYFVIGRRTELVLLS